MLKGFAAGGGPSPRIAATGGPDCPRAAAARQATRTHAVEARTSRLTDSGNRPIRIALCPPGTAPIDDFSVAEGSDARQPRVALPADGRLGDEERDLTATVAREGYRQVLPRRVGKCAGERRGFRGPHDLLEPQMRR